MEEPRGLMINDVAGMVGISRETLRYYEQKGIIRPYKGEKNNYRSYSMQDICILIRVRIYLQYGLSLDEAKLLIYEKDEQYADEFLRKRMDIVENEINSLTSMLKCMRRRHLDLLDTMKTVGQFRVETRPKMALLCVTNCNGDVLTHAGIRNTYAKWVNELLDSFPYMEYVMNDKKERIGDFTGQGIFLLDGGECGQPLANYVTLYPPCECLHTGIVMHQGPSIRDDAPLYEILCYMDDKGLKHDNKIFARTMHVCSDEIGYKYYRDIWVPIRA